MVEGDGTAQLGDPSRRPIADLFVAQVACTPAAIAVQQGDVRLTYAELHHRSDRLARHLQTLGVGPDVLVAICLDRSIELVVSVLGVLKAGGAYVPLDPAYPAERLRYMVSDSRPRAMLTTAALAEVGGDFAGPVVLLDTESLPDLPAPTVAPLGPDHVDDLAYVIYTSGSTGRPKGVVVPQTGWGNYIASAQQTYGLRDGERLLQFASFSWDTSAEEMFPCLTSGATLVLRTPDMLDSIPHFLARCAEWNITCLNLPTAFWHELVAQLHEDGLHLPDCIRAVAIGGERGHWESLAKWRECAPPQVQLFNTYGQTECTAVTACVQLTADLPEGTFPLGRPIPNVECHLLDPERRPVADGETGELFVGGPGVARGYLGRPELTAEKFVDSPFAEGGRLYRTGDLVRRWPDGNLEFVGRADLQVKMNGILIEPGEIEDVLQRHPSVRVSAVVGRPAGPTPKFLAAFVVLTGSASCTADDLRHWLRTYLPDFMLPASITVVDALPLTPNGKLDRNALDSLDPTVNASVVDAAMTDTEAALAGIWCEVLGVSSVALDAHFFDMGGNSLLAMRVIARVRARLGVELSVRALFDASTLREFGARVEQHLVTVWADDLPPLVGAIDAAPVASFEQESLWFLDQLQPGNPTYNIVDVVRLTGPLVVPALQQAIDGLVSRHDSLRTTFAQRGGLPQPIVVPNANVALELVDEPGVSEHERAARAVRLAEDAVARSFDLRTGPLLRAMLVRFDDLDHALIVTIHHIVSDGWSIPIFFEELARFYDAQVTGTPVLLPDLPMQYLEYAAWQRRALSQQRLDEHRAYWVQRLRGSTPLEFPLDRPRPATRTYDGARVPVQFGRELTARMNEWCADEDVTLFMLLVTAYQLTLSRYTDQRDITIGTATANRQHADAEGLIGIFINTLAVRTDLHGSPTFRQLVQHVKETLLGAFEHSALPFGDVVHAVDPPRSANRNPLFDVMLLLQNLPTPILPFENVATEFLAATPHTSEFDFTLDLTETVDGLHGACEYDTALFDASTMQRFVAEFEALLACAIAHPDEHVDDLPVLTSDERQQLLVDWNATERTFPDVGTIPDLFEARAARWPERVIAIDGDVRLTYTELDRRADQLARHLRSSGVREDDVVGVCLPRSLHQLVAVLAVLKAGAAYLPMDPAYPIDRLQYMLADSGAVHLVTDAPRAALFVQAHLGTTLVDAHAAAIAEHTPTPVQRTTTGESACVLIYTSGSTGRPNGVVGEHRAALNRFQWMWERYPFTADDVCCQKTASSFVDSVWETFGPLLQGVPLVLIGDDFVRDPRAFVAELAHHRVTRVVLVPSLLRMMLEAVPDLAAALPDLMLWVCSGEALEQELADEFLRRVPGRLLLNLYGSSEAAGDSTFHELRQPGDRVLIGRPIANTDVHLLDSLGRLVPIGAVGEIHIGGAGLARGYRNNPELTATRFVPHPFRDGARLYRTGDLGRRTADGALDHLGRIDQQVKVGGMRIELGEVERALLESPAVHRALAAVHDGRLVGYVLPEPGHTVVQSDLVATVRARLPQHMVPTSFVVLDAFPLTPNGKVDRLALPAPTADAAAGGRAVRRAPSDDLEHSIARVWQRVLGVSEVGVDDDFFSIGGHSLLVVRLVTQLEAELGTRLSLGMVFEAPTVTQMAALVREQRADSGYQCLVPARTTGSQPPLFCVHADGGTFMYQGFVDHLSSEQPVYGFQARGLVEGEEPFTSVEDMAAHYLAEMRRLQPVGPHRIAAFSMGGVVIHEIAHRLHASGEPAPLVIFIDAATPAHFEGNDTRSFGAKLLGLVKLGVRGGLVRGARRVQQRYLLAKGNRMLRRSDARDLSLSPAMRIQRVRTTNHRIADAYVPPTYAGPVTVLHAADQGQREVVDTTLGWAAHVTGPITLAEIPGDHETIFREPDLTEMAKAVQRRIDEWSASQS